MEDIEFIKWLVNYAEGFTWNQFGFGINIPERAYSVTPKEFEQDKLMYALLLQRAIEGINLSKSEYEVDLINGVVEVCKGEYSKLVLLPYTKHITYDQAKEQALKYIWEQEK